ncbi:unnamed protein product [Adineta ricciae]|uniref:Peptidase M14 domain-containing protein n=1 Tax=Adineta ricciae TaxID=249248 RepID=A0A814RXU4_ADIRI|nr:unnamed protein product [Adineta ricciae]
MEVGESSYALLTSPYDSFMQKHLQHYGYFTGRHEVVKKYGFVPSKPQLISSSSDSNSSSDDEDQAQAERRSPPEHGEYKGRSLLADQRASLRQNRLRCGLYLRSQNDDSSFEPRWPIEIEVLSDSRVRHINVVPKQPEPFYKSTGRDHMPSVRSIDEKFGRVVFNYNPETCGYFVRSRIGGNRDGCRQAAVTLRGPEDTTVLFESRFESGNLMKAVQVGEFEYELYLRYDLYTKRNTQWFYFRLQNVQSNKRYRFTIVNFFKTTSLYNNGMRPLMYSVHDAEHKKIGWRRWGEEIVYYRNNLTAPENSTVFMYSLTWTCKFPNDSDTYYFAHCYPYTYSDLQDYLNSIQNDRIKGEYCKQKVLCRSLAGNFVYMLTITSPAASTKIPEQQIKKGVVVTARVHPGETNASWMMKGLLDFLLSDSPDAKLLRDNFVFKIVPMLNPDGVIVGNYRCSLSGRDLNRNYKTILKDAYPSIWHTREMIKRFMTEIELVVYCDFHGHSRRNNVFIYGCENKREPKERFKERIFPSIFSKNDPCKFSYSSCRFKVQKQKEGTGRIVMWSMGIKNSFTLESTFCGSTLNEQAGHQFNTIDLESIGYHFLDSILDYSDPDPTKRNRLLTEARDNLRQAIRLKLISRGINPSTISDADLDQYSSEDDSSDDAGSDSSADDGLPKHLEAMAAVAKARVKKTRKNREVMKPSKEPMIKEEPNKENANKVKPIGLTMTTSRKVSLPIINHEPTKQTVSQPPAQLLTTRRGGEEDADADPDAAGNLTNATTASYPTMAEHSRSDEDTSLRVTKDTQGGFIISRMPAAHCSDDGRSQMSNFITNRISGHLTERLIGPSRPHKKMRSPMINITQSQTVLDIQAIQPPIQTGNPRRVFEQQQHQRQRVLTVFGKQDSADSVDRLNSFSKNSIPLPVYDRKVDEILSNRDDSSATLSRSAPKPADTEPINIVFSYEHSPQNRPQGIGKPPKKTKA